MQRTIELSDDQIRELERLAAHEHRSIDELVQLAVGDYLARRQRDWSDWGQRFDAVVAKFRQDLPPGVTPETIEAEISEARAEDRAERASVRNSARAADADGR